MQGSQMTEMGRVILPEIASQFLPDTLEQTKINKVRAILGEAAKEMDDAQLETCIAQCEYLIDSWLNEYERQLFAGKTLNEMLKDG